MKLKHILAPSLGMTVATLGAAQAETVKIGSIAEYQPYNYLDDEGEMQGFEAGFAGLLCMQASITCEWVLAPAEDLISNLQTYEFDIIISAMEISAANMVYKTFRTSICLPEPVQQAAQSLPMRLELASIHQIWLCLII